MVATTLEQNIEHDNDNDIDWRSTDRPRVKRDYGKGQVMAVGCRDGC